MTPPPGWYPDPTAPPTERWWDGAAWTEHRRQPQNTPAAPQAFGPPVEPPLPAAGPQLPPAAPGRRAKAIALAAAGIVLVAAIATGAVLLGRGDDDPRSRTAPTTSTPTPTDPTATASSAEPTPTEDASTAADLLNGITLPVLDGWQKAENVVDDDMLITTPGTYDCPGDSGLCRHGTIVSRTVTGTDETSPEAIAEQDIKDAANASYDKNGVDRQPFGGIESHQQIAARQTAVAGRAGYLVRWKVKTAKGPGGYVQSVVFPSSAGSESLVTVRITVDAGEDAPPLTDMDRIVKGIRAAGDSGADGGVGSSIGPTVTP
ncbi:DUF2510 domain-containing protein [Streptomyces sp. NPDC048641]|uniref:DUF2510 domain-containing protein n=1 Tax=Streptomyces sp. NPDC048641 TaxID=3154825 RepID=UPI003437E3C8